MGTIRVFYVVYVPEGETRACIDAMRYLCNPRERHCAHITVRGPYDGPQDLGEASNRVRGLTVKVSGVGSFFGPSQNTVYLKCECPEVQQVWDKKDYAEFNPHITLYDGNSRELADALLDALRRCPLRFEFVAEGLSPLVSIKGEPNFSLRDHFAADAVSRILREVVDADSVQDLADSERVGYARRICCYLAGILEAGNGSPRVQDQAAHVGRSDRLAPTTKAG